MSDLAQHTARRAQSWLQMPAISDGEGPIAVRPKYSVDADALLIYRGSNVYMMVQDDRARAGLTSYPDVRVLTALESHGFEESLPFPVATRTAGMRTGTAGVQLGDLVHRVTRRLGIQHCAGCRKRRTALNRVVVWGWWRRA